MAGVKPRIKPHLLGWACHGDGLVACGATPTAAYWSWWRWMERTKEFQKLRPGVPFSECAAQAALYRRTPVEWQFLARRHLGKRH